MSHEEMLVPVPEKMKTEGVKFDQGKTRLDLFPGDVLYAIGTILTFGAVKYAARNWELGMDWGRCFGALQRHLWSWWQGEDKDPESGKSHLWHAGCMLVFLIAYEIRGVGKDDRPERVQKVGIVPTTTQTS